MLVDFENPELTGEFAEPRPGGTHNGIDLGIPTSTPIHSAKKGVVVQVEDRFGEGDKSTPNGNFVRIDYDDQTQDIFIHMLDVEVEQDQGVATGERIATSDDTVYSKGPHLYFTQYDESKTPVNPMDVHHNC